jgi:hypothetical protein
MCGSHQGLRKNFASYLKAIFHVALQQVMLQRNMVVRDTASYRM